MKCVALLLMVLMFTGCLRFGDNIELAGVNFTSEHLRKISERTGIRFPSGSQGINYFYQGDAIDPSLAAKIEIPKVSREELLTNDVFKLGQSEGINIHGGATEEWWHPETLSSRLHFIQELPKSCILECIVGDENGKLILYLKWATF